MIDVDKAIAEYEEILRAGGGAEERRDALEILMRWQWDEDLAPASRERARKLVREFSGRY